MSDAPAAQGGQTIPFRSFALEGLLYYPNDHDQGVALCNGRAREAFVRLARTDNRWPIKLERDVFDLLADTPPPDALFAPLEGRRALGWLIHTAFLYYLRASAWPQRRGNLSEGMGELATQNKFRVFLEGQTKGFVPGTQVPRPDTEGQYNKARKEFWSAAHCWATAFLVAPDTDLHDLSSKQWDLAMEMAANFRCLGLELGIFEQLAPAGRFRPDAVVSVEGYEPAWPMEFASFLPEDLQALGNYVSRQTLSKQMAR